MGVVPMLWMVVAAGVGYGWTPDGAGGVEYVIQISPEKFDQAKASGEITSTIAPEVRGSVSRLVIRIGDGPLERISPSEIAARDDMVAVPIPEIDESGQARPIIDALPLAGYPGAVATESVMKPAPQDSGGGGFTFPARSGASPANPAQDGARQGMFQQQQAVQDLSNRARQGATETIDELRQRAAGWSSDLAEQAAGGVRNAIGSAFSADPSAVRGNQSVTATPSPFSQTDDRRDPRFDATGRLSGSVSVGAPVGTRGDGPSTAPTSAAAANQWYTENTRPNPGTSAFQPSEQMQSLQGRETQGMSIPPQGNVNTADPRFADGYADPRFIDPRQTDPRFTDPRFADPRQTDPRFTDPRFTDPRFADPRQTDPRFTDPRFTDPRFTDSRFTDPRFTDPRQTDSRNADPRYADSRPTNPVATDPRIGVTQTFGRMPSGQSQHLGQQDQQAPNYLAESSPNYPTGTHPTGAGTVNGTEHPPRILSDPRAVTEGLAGDSSWPGSSRERLQARGVRGENELIESASDDRSATRGRTPAATASPTQRMPEIESELGTSSPRVRGSKTVAAQPVFNGLLLFSFVANIYLVVWLKNLRHEFRELVANKRAARSAVVAD